METDLFIVVAFNSCSFSGARLKISYAYINYTTLRNPIKKAS